MKKFMGFTAVLLSLSILFGSVGAAAADFDALDEGGMGLNLIRQSASEMRYVRQDDRNVLTLRFAIGMNRS